MSPTVDTERAHSSKLSSRDVDDSPSTLKTIRYEETPLGTPPIPVVTATTLQPVSSITPAMSTSLRPMTAPAPRAGRVSQFSENFKRDSGIASSPRSPLSPAALSPSVPHSSPGKDSNAEASPSRERKTRTALSRRRSKKGKQKPRSVSPPSFRPLSSFRGLETDIPTGELEDLDADNFGFTQRGSIFFGNDMKSWFGPSSNAVAQYQEQAKVSNAYNGGALAHEKEQVNSTRAYDDLSFPQHQKQADSTRAHNYTSFAPQHQEQVSSTRADNDASFAAHQEQVTSTRAYNGDAFVAPGTALSTEVASDKHTIPPPGTAVTSDYISLPRAVEPRPGTKPPPADESPVLPSTPLIVEPDQVEGSDKAALPPTRLVAGRRKPSVQMLQAAIAGGRVLSAEEITFSMKVRSMYEAGDESAADWSATSLATSNDTPDTLTTKDSTEASIEASSAARTRQGMASRASRRSQDIRASYYVKNNQELAGGIEDWQDINSADIDRYGFIMPKQEAGRPLSMAGAPEGLHRVATGLRIAADQPRRRGLRRTPSNARSSRSVPPQGATRPSSMHSATSAATSVKSRRSAFKGKHRRITDAAGDMLTLPPGLADIAEKEDDGQALAALRRREWSRNEKWQKMARPLQDSMQSSGGGMHFDFDTSDPKVISRTWKGIPDRWRATAWHSFLSASARRRGNFESDKALIQQFNQLQDQNCADDYQIDVDVPRTISMHVMFRRRYRGGQRLLFRVLHAIALHFPETSYVQGMASLAATMLCYFDEERAFVMLVRLWQLRGLEQLFQPGFEGLMTALKDLEDKWLAGSDVAQKLNELSISSTAYGTRWYLTLFNMSVPFPAQLRIWDVYMLLGDATPIGKGAFGGADLDVLHATSAALIDATREIIIDSDFENAMKVLTSFVPIRDEDLLMRVARAEWKMNKKRHGGAS